MKENKRLLVPLMIVIILAAMIFVYFNNGITQGNVVNYIYNNLNVPKAYANAVSYSDDMFAAVFYDESLDKHTFAIFVDHNPLLKRYQFKYSGSSAQVKNGVEVYQLDKGKVIVSLNKERVDYIELESESHNRKINVNPDKPFVVVIEKDMKIKSMRNPNGESVPFKSIDI